MRPPTAAAACLVLAAPAVALPNVTAAMTTNTTSGLIPRIRPLTPSTLPTPLPRRASVSVDALPGVRLRPLPGPAPTARTARGCPRSAAPQARAQRGRRPVPARPTRLANTVAAPRRRADSAAANSIKPTSTSRAPATVIHRMTGPVPVNASALDGADTAPAGGDP